MPMLIDVARREFGPFAELQRAQLRDIDFYFFLSKIDFFFFNSRDFK